MKVALISTYTCATPPLTYGGESYYWGLAKTLAEMGHEVHLFGKGGSQTPPGGYLHTISGTENGAIYYKKETWVYDHFKDLLLSCDIVHDCSLSKIVAERLRFIHDKQEIVNTINGHTYYMPRPPFNVVTGSKFWQEDAKASGLNTEMIYWGIDTDFYTPGDEPREDYILWLSRFHPDKGLSQAMLLANYLGFELKVAGSMEFKDHRDYGKQYSDKIDQLPNIEIVRLPMDSTHHIAKRELYRKAKAFLYPVQYQECFGMVVTEAMACGCPVMATPNGAMPELIKHGESGWLCPRDGDFGKVLFSIQDGVPEEMREQARTQALQFSWQAAAEQYNDLYSKVVDGYGW